MMIRLALRSLAIRPWRTAVLAAGFGLGIGVMAALLGVGEVILEQAHAPALNGGGDLIASSALGTIDNARFVLANVVGAPQFRGRIAAASPTRKATLYLVKPGVSIPVAVRGGIPSLERAVVDPEVAGIHAWADEPGDAAWSRPSANDVLRAIDRFHPVPVVTGSDVSAAASAKVDPRSWAEWLYFNGRTPDGRLRFYLTFLAGPGLPDGRRSAFVRLQLERDGRSTDYSAAAAIDAASLLERAPDLDIGGNLVRVDNGRYRLSLALAREGAPRNRPGSGPATLTGEIVLDAPPGRSVPPVEIRAAHGWVTGYVVPVLSGPIHGTLRVGRESISLDGAAGYHDHNWGFWEGVRWQWGQVAAGDVSIVYGRVFPPSAVADPDRVPGFLGVLGPDGPLGYSSDVTIRETGDPEGTPTAIAIDARGRDLRVGLSLTVEESERSRMGLTQLASGQTMTFLQMGGTFRVAGRIGERALDFTARGSAETFRSSNP
jgi:hypothetical protein